MAWQIPIANTSGLTNLAGADLLVEVNTGGSLAADFAIRLAATALSSMAESDFIL